MMLFLELKATYSGAMTLPCDLICHIYISTFSQYIQVNQCRHVAGKQFESNHPGENALRNILLRSSKEVKANYFRAALQVAYRSSSQIICACLKIETIGGIYVKFKLQRTQSSHSSQRWYWKIKFHKNFHHDLISLRTTLQKKTKSHCSKVTISLTDSCL